MRRHEEQGGTKDHAHGLPGTNQAGKGPDTCESDDQERRPGAPAEEQLEAHSLPGTNQAGKGPGDCEPDDQERRPDTPAQDQVEAHSLPGTNQAGTGPGEEHGRPRTSRAGGDRDPGE